MFLDIISSLLFFSATGVVLIGALMLGGPGADNNGKTVGGLCLFFSYPSLIGLLYYLNDRQFWSIEPQTLLVWTLGINALILSPFLFLLIKIVLGINNSGYGKFAGWMFHDGKPLGVKASDFRIVIPGYDSASGSDEYGRLQTANGNAYYNGIRIENVDTSRIELIDPYPLVWTDGAYVYSEAERNERLFSNTDDNA